MTRRFGSIPCRVYPGAFDGEYQVQILPPGQTQEVFSFAPVSSTNEVKTPVLPTGTSGTLQVVVVGESGESYLIDLPGETHPIGPRLRVPKNWVSVQS